MSALVPRQSGALVISAEQGGEGISARFGFQGSDQALVTEAFRAFLASGDRGCIGECVEALQTIGRQRQVCVAAEAELARARGMQEGASRGLEALVGQRTALDQEMLAEESAYEKQTAQLQGAAREAAQQCGRQAGLLPNPLSFPSVRRAAELSGSIVGAAVGVLAHRAQSSVEEQCAQGVLACGEAIAAPMLVAAGAAYGAGRCAQLAQGFGACEQKLQGLTAQLEERSEAHRRAQDRRQEQRQGLQQQEGSHLQDLTSAGELQKSAGAEKQAAEQRLRDGVTQQIQAIAEAQMELLRKMQFADPSTRECVGGAAIETLLRSCVVQAHVECSQRRQLEAL